MLRFFIVLNVDLIQGLIDRKTEVSSIDLKSFKFLQFPYNYIRSDQQPQNTTKNGLNMQRHLLLNKILAH